MIEKLLKGMIRKNLMNIRGENNMYIKINDIRHTNNGRGTSLKSKIGEKYEYRKNKMYECIPLPDAPSEYGLDFIEVDENGHPTGYKIETTPFVKAASNARGDICIMTRNSIYDCIDITKEIEKKLAEEILEDRER